jgi:serine/threonine protein kinase
MCFLVDGAGLLITHSDFVKTREETMNILKHDFGVVGSDAGSWPIENVFIGVKEPPLARALQGAGVLKMSGNVTNPDSTQLLNYFVLNLEGGDGESITGVIGTGGGRGWDGGSGDDDKLTSERCLLPGATWSLARVRGTNVFLMAVYGYERRPTYRTTCAETHAPPATDILDGRMCHVSGESLFIPSAYADKGQSSASLSPPPQCVSTEIVNSKPSLPELDLLRAIVIGPDSQCAVDDMAIQAWELAVVIASAVLFVIVLSIVIVAVLMRRKYKRKIAMMEEIIATLSPEQEELVDDILSQESHLELWRVSFDDIDTGRKLGQGAKGQVYASVWRGTPCALKRLDADGIDEEALVRFREEISLMIRLRHPNVVQLVGACWEKRCIGILLELMEYGSMSTGVLQNDSINLKWHRPLLAMVQDICRGMCYLHSNDPPILHRDLKGDNCFVNQSLVVKVGDFGESRSVARGQSTMSIIGTNYFCAPEVLTGQAYDEKVDVYSFAILLGEIVVRPHPVSTFFSEMESMSVALKVAQEWRPEIPNTPLGQFPLVRQLILDCWNHDPALRPSFHDILGRLTAQRKGSGGGSSAPLSRQEAPPSLTAGIDPLGGGGRKYLQKEEHAGGGGGSSILSSSSRSTSDGGDSWGAAGRRQGGAPVKLPPLQPRALPRTVDAKDERLLNLATLSAGSSIAADEPSFEKQALQEEKNSGAGEFEKKVCFGENPNRETKTGPLSPKSPSSPSSSSSAHVWRSKSIKLASDSTTSTNSGAAAGASGTSGKDANTPNSMGGCNGTSSGGDGDQFDSGSTLSDQFDSGSRRQLMSKRQSEEQEMQSDLWHIEIDELEVGPVIGEGAYGKVYEGVYQGTHVAVKKLFVIKTIPEKAQRGFREECKLMARLRHPNIVLFMGFVMTDEDFVIVLELCEEGSLHDMYSNGDQPPLADHRAMVLKTSADICRGMAYLHGRKPAILHRDLKSLNVLMTESFTAKIGDFGMSRVRHAYQTMTRTMGTLLWTSPEVLKGRPATEASDVYAFGVVLWEVTHWSEPFVGQSSFSVAMDVSQGKRPEMAEEALATILPGLADLIREVWSSDEDARPSFVEILRKLDDRTLERVAATPHLPDAAHMHVASTV